MPPTDSTCSLLAQGGSFSLYWRNFLEYWHRVLVTENGIVMSVLLVGVVAIFILTRGKWRK